MAGGGGKRVINADKSNVQCRMIAVPVINQLLLSLFRLTPEFTYPLGRVVGERNRARAVSRWEQGVAVRRYHVDEDVLRIHAQKRIAHIDDLGVAVQFLVQFLQHLLDTVNNSRESCLGGFDEIGAPLRTDDGRKGKTLRQNRCEVDVVAADAEHHQIRVSRHIVDLENERLGHA